MSSVMKKLIVAAMLALASFGANAQFFDFEANLHRFEVGLNLGQAGYSTGYAHFGIGASILACGFYIDFLHADPQHKYDNRVIDVLWPDTEACCINAGYQIPITSWLRIMPLAGYAQTNEGYTDGGTLYWNSSDSDASLYHKYRVTPGSRIHYFNYGGGISIQPCKWLSINAVYTKYAVYGGIAVAFNSF